MWSLSLNVVPELVEGAPAPAAALSLRPTPSSGDTPQRPAGKLDSERSERITPAGKLEVKWIFT